MSLERINPAELSPPTGFSHAVAASGSRLVFLAGQTALDASGKVVGDTLPEQFERALANLLAALAASGATPADLVRVTVYTVDVDAYRTHASELGRVWRRLAAASTRRWRSSGSSASGTSPRWSNWTVLPYSIRPYPSCRIADQVLLTASQGGVRVEMTFL